MVITTEKKRKKGDTHSPSQPAQPASAAAIKVLLLFAGASLYGYYITVCLANGRSPAQPPNKRLDVALLSYK
jgi:hypothetical protein